MAFVSKLGNVLKQTTMHVKSEMFPSAPSLYQTIRGMAGSKLFVGGLSYNTTDESLRDAFDRYGSVIEARIIMDRDSGRSRGFGFVSFTSENEAAAAITAMDGQELHGRLVRVNYATERSGGYRGGGGGYGDGYGGGGGGGGYQGGGYGGGGYQGGGGGRDYGPGGGYLGGGGNYGGGGGGGYQGGGGGYGGGGGGYQGGGGGYGGGGRGNYGPGGGYLGGGGDHEGGGGSNYGGGGGNYGGGDGGDRYVPGSSVPSGPATSFQGDIYSKNKVDSFDSGAPSAGGGGGDINNISNAPTNSLDDILAGNENDEGLNSYDGEDALESGDDEGDDDFAKRRT